jgi:DNA polymerase III subunit epsilon
MYDSDLAIVDLETTGLTARYDRIIEIAILRVQNGEVTETYSSLVDPEMIISPYIESLTGITNKDLHDAPTFTSIRNDVFRLLDGALFVAHNARFDYGFVREEFRREGIGWSAPCLCTVRLSRRLYPEHRKHSLDSIMERFGLRCMDRHRALGDAAVVWDFMKLLSTRFQEADLKEAFRKISKTPTMPPLIEESVARNLPESTGVYIFYDQAGGPLYVGKGKNIKSRVYSHFSNGSRFVKEAAIFRQTAGIKTIETAGELGALLLESRLIKEMLPLYNRRSRARKGLSVAKKTVDESGYGTIIIENPDIIDVGELEDIVGIFKSQKQAREFLWLAAKEHRLCPKKLGLEKKTEECSYCQLGICRGACTGAEPPSTYNLRFALAMTGRGVRTWPFEGPVLIEEGTGRGRGEAFLVDKWCLLASYQFDGQGRRQAFRSDYTFDYDTYRILLHYVMKQESTARLQEITYKEMESLLDE